MKLALLVIENGRPYLYETLSSARDHIHAPITNRLMVDDAPSPWSELDHRFPEYIIRHTGGIGMAGAVAAGFQLCIDADPEFVFWLEGDMRLTANIPIEAATQVLRDHENIAQMCFRREPWWGSPDEMRTGCQLQAICEQSHFAATHWGKAGNYTTHDFIFSLNPGLIRTEVMRLGWPAGPIGIGNEAGFTKKALDQGYLFGSWGHPGDGQCFATHVGEQRGAGWAL